MKDDDHMSGQNPPGGPAFPVSIQGCGDNGWHGMSLRDWFATHCHEDEIPKLTVGDIRKRFRIAGDQVGTDAQWQIARCEARYAYADAMLAVRKSKT